MTAYGIDFGTTNSVLAQWAGDRVDVLPVDEPPGVWAEEGFDRVLPSVLAVDPDGTTSFGWAARRRPHDAKLAAVKRLLATDEFVRVGAHELSVEQAAAMLFGQLAHASPGVSVDRAVVTIPANSMGVARLRTKLCAGLSGISVPALINEPTAAAMAFARTTRRDETVLVFDWGGGTLDVTVLEAIDGVFMERASKGIGRLGGIDLDRAFAAAVEQHHGPIATAPAQRDQFLADIEYAKVRLSRQESYTLPGGQTVTRDLLEQAVAPLVHTARGPVEQCLEDLKMRPGDIDQLVLVGGTSTIPAVRAMVAEVVGREPAAGVDPMTAVAEGAAIASAILAGELDLDFFVSTEHALGTVVHNTGRPTFSVLIPRNHQLPAKAVDRYQPAADGQESVLVRVIEGDPDKPVEHDENVVLRELTIAVDPDVPHQEAAFDIAYAYDVDGILDVTITDARTDQVMHHETVTFGVSRDRAALVAVADEVRTATRTGRLDRPTAAGPADAESAALLGELRTKVLPFVSEPERARLDELARAVADATDADRPARVASLRAELRSYSYLL